MAETVSPKDRLKAKLKRLQQLQAWALKSQDYKRLNAMIALARSEPGIPILPEDLDRDPMLFNCWNGTLELKTGKLREHRREDCITKLCPTSFDENATCPVWIRFLEEVFLGDTDVIGFVRRLLGYCLTGDVREHVLPIFWGRGGNGKSTLLNAVLDVMGPEYAMKAPAELLMASNGERHPTELAQLFGMRLIVASESEQGARIKEALIKDLTGGEHIRARRMREDFWEFAPTHKLIMQTNHKPRVVGTDEGIWRRLRLVPFKTRFRKADEASDNRGEHEKPADTGLPEKLKAEAPGILAWLAGGCLDWHQHGLTLPETVKAATQEYRKSEDVIATWLDDCCVQGAGCRVKAGQLYGSFKGWCESNGETLVKQRAFGASLTERGFQREKSSTTWYVGVELRQEETGMMG